ncbi:hypothetical protein CDCA_CDCA15G4051 [Cyanidium caldarium]|uniref:Uncharacterized protein n=1 Tax=Cyanidium caldarium TaxID=2771 RepID=A0AAV9J0X3_CYACA|nr:hypothetical protein CDCA_CDCA15G4051 [Cyanidium caldarium]
MEVSPPFDVSEYASLGPFRVNYRWFLIAVPESSRLTVQDLWSPRTPSLHFAPDVPGDYVLCLKTYGHGATFTDYIRVRCEDPDAHPNQLQEEEEEEEEEEVGARERKVSDEVARVKPEADAEPPHSPSHSPNTAAATAPTGTDWLIRTTFTIPLPKTRAPYQEPDDLGDHGGGDDDPTPAPDAPSTQLTDDNEVTAADVPSAST